MTSAVLAAGVPGRRPARASSAFAASPALPLPGGVVRGSDPCRTALQGAGFLLLAMAVHSGVALFFMGERGHDETQPRPVPVEITLARPLPSAPATPPSPLPQARKPVKPLERRLAEPVRPAVASAQHAEPSEVPPAAAAVEAGKASAAPSPAPAEVVAPVVAETVAVGRMGYLNNPPPEYPASALDRGLEGTSLLKVRVLASGHAASVEIERSSGARILDDAAIRTVRRWLFVPATRDGQAVDGWANVPIIFKLGK